MTRDSLGNPLAIGDVVGFVATYTKRMDTAKFLGMTAGGNFKVDHSRGFSYQVFKVMQPEITYDQYLEKTGAPRNPASREKWLELLENTDA